MDALQLAANGMPHDMHRTHEQVRTRVVLIQVKMKYLAAVHSSEGPRSAFCCKRLNDQTSTTISMTKIVALVQAQRIT